MKKLFILIEKLLNRVMGMNLRNELIWLRQRILSRLFSIGLKIDEKRTLKHALRWFEKKNNEN